VRISAVFETHVHNDYVSGGLALAGATGASYVLSADDEVAFDHVRLGEGGTLRVGALTVRALHTPGHTFSHLSYLVELGGQVVGAFTGGSLLYGATGRPDLLGAAATPVLARAQHRSARRLAAELPTQTRRCTPPTGSAASARPPSRRPTRPPSAASCRSTTR
jgi:hydroxyacylglutathione hydrolase